VELVSSKNSKPTRDRSRIGSGDPNNVGNPDPILAAILLTSNTNVVTEAIYYEGAVTKVRRARHGRN
jgi:hypothetical protein